MKELKNEGMKELKNEEMKEYGQNINMQLMSDLNLDVDRYLSPNSPVPIPRIQSSMISKSIKLSFTYNRTNI